MIFAKVDVTLPGQHRMLAVPRGARASALGCWLAALCYSRRHELDGWCPVEAIDAYATDEIIGHLVRVGLFARDEKDGVHGVNLLGFAESNETAAEVAERKRVQRERKVGPKLRRFVIERDGLRCRLCGSSVELRDAHIDHRRPFSQGGATVPDNLQVTHARCNREKGARFQ